MKRKRMTDKEDKYPCPNCGRTDFDSLGEWIRHHEDHRAQSGIFADTPDAMREEKKR